MDQILHGSATTTTAVRRAIQHSQESLRALANRYGINQKTVAKWKKRTSAADLPTGPKRTEIEGPLDRGGGGHRRLQA
jgi:DNA-binding transcriptional regulator YiaG